VSRKPRVHFSGLTGDQSATQYFDRPKEAKKRGKGRKRRTTIASTPLEEKGKKRRVDLGGKEDRTGLMCRIVIDTLGGWGDRKMGKEGEKKKRKFNITGPERLMH